jgi:hypothetical protein
MAANATQPYDVRDLGVGGILDQAIRIVRDHFGPLLRIFLPLLAFNLVLGLVNVFVAPVDSADASPEENAAAVAAALPTTLAFTGAQVIGALIIGSWINAALMHFVAQKYLGHVITPGAALARGWRRYGPVVWTTLLVGATIGVGFLLLIIPGIYFSFWYLLSQQVTVVENISGWQAMKRSRALMKGSMNTAFLVLLVLGILGFVLGSGAGLLGNPYLITGTTVVLQSILTLVSLTALVVLYFSCRCKEENFDLEHVAASLGAESPTVRLGDERASIPAENPFTRDTDPT